jgi:predicted RNA-binding protein with PUA-like domain
VGDASQRMTSPTAPRCWLMKSEPDSFSIDDLERVKQTPWEGVRNYQARNLMRDDMKVGDAVLFYHSNADPPAVVGLARVASPPYPDPSAFDRKSPYFDEKSKRDAPRWILVDVAFIEKLHTPVPLARLRDDPALRGMLVAQKGQRLSVQPVDPTHFEHVAAVAGATRLSQLLKRE